MPDHNDDLEQDQTTEEHGSQETTAAERVADQALGKALTTTQAVTSLRPDDTAHGEAERIKSPLAKGQELAGEIPGPSLDTERIPAPSEFGDDVNLPRRPHVETAIPILQRQPVSPEERRLEDRSDEEEIKVVTDDDLKELFAQADLCSSAPEPEAPWEREEERQERQAKNREDIVNELEGKLEHLESEVEVGDFHAVGAAKKGQELEKTKEEIEKLDTVSEDFLNVDTLRELFHVVNNLIDKIQTLTVRLDALERELREKL